MLLCLMYTQENPELSVFYFTHHFGYCFSIVIKLFAPEMETEISNHTDLTQWQGITKTPVAVNENSDYWTR